MKKWNDVYRMVKNGDLDASLLKTGCENLKAARERAIHVMEGFKEKAKVFYEDPQVTKDWSDGLYQTIQDILAQ